MYLQFNLNYDAKIMNGYGKIESYAVQCVNPALPATTIEARREVAVVPCDLPPTLLCNESL